MQDKQVVGDVKNIDMGNTDMRNTKEEILITALP